MKCYSKTSNTFETKTGLFSVYWIFSPSFNFIFSDQFIRNFDCFYTTNKSEIVKRWCLTLDLLKIGFKGKTIILKQSCNCNLVVVSTRACCFYCVKLKVSRVSLMLLRIFLDDTIYLRTSNLMMLFIFYHLKHCWQKRLCPAAMVR